jgi:excisionase family DNA binding protein
MGPTSYTTTEVARKLGVSRATLQQWIKDGRLRPPRIHVRVGKPPVRMWTKADIGRLQSVKEQMQKKVGRPKKA